MYLLKNKSLFNLELIILAITTGIVRKIYDEVIDDPIAGNKNSRTSIIGHFVPNDVPILRYQEKTEALSTYKKHDLLIQKSQSY